jgi:hypothetical protein
MEPQVSMAMVQMPATKGRRPHRRFFMLTIVRSVSPDHKRDEGPTVFTIASQGLHVGTLGEHAGSMRSTPVD